MASTEDKGSEPRPSSNAKAQGDPISVLFGALTVLSALLLAALALGCAFALHAATISMIMQAGGVWFGIAALLLIWGAHVVWRNRNFRARGDTMPGPLRRGVGTFFESDRGPAGVGGILLNGFGVAAAIALLMDVRQRVDFDSAFSDLVGLLFAFIAVCVGGYLLVRCAEATDQAVSKPDRSDPAGRSDNGDI